MSHQFIQDWTYRLYETQTLQKCWSLINYFAALSELQSAVDSGYQRSLERWTTKTKPTKYYKNLQKLKMILCCRVLKDEGAFAITNLDPSYAIAVRQIKSKAPECLEQLKFPQVCVDWNLSFEFLMSSVLPPWWLTKKNLRKGKHANLSLPIMY